MNHKKYVFSFYGHNCFVIESEDVFLAIDPWLDKAGAFFGSWFQYPKNHHLQEKFINLTKRKRGFIFLTHEHEDHFDLNTLSAVDKNVKVLIPSYNDKFMVNKLAQFDFEVLELTDSEKFKIDDLFFVSPFISDIGVNHDSALLIETSEFTFFNQNDCKIFDRLDDIKVPITYYSAQFSGATSHPIKYVNYTAQQVKKISQSKIDAKIKNILDAVKKLKPKFYLPAAGPAIFPYLSDEYSQGIDNIFIHQDYLHKRLIVEEKVGLLYPRPGDEISVNRRDPIPPPTVEYLEEYRRGLACTWDRIDLPFNKDELVAAISMRLDQIWDLEFQCECMICFKWGSGMDNQIFIDLENKEILNDTKVGKFNLYTVEADKKYFSLMCGNYRWQDISLSLRANLKREPDIFNNFVNIFLFSDVSNIRKAFESSLSIPKERITVMGANKCLYEIDRYCPHQGADLSNAEIDSDNKIICPRHSWRFSLSGAGACETNNSTISAVLVKK